MTRTRDAELVNATPKEFLEEAFDVPHRSPLQPQQLRLEDRFQFRCHPGVSCFNACCRDIDITLTPYDIVVLKRRLGMEAADFVARYTTPFEMDHHGLPGLRMNAKPGSRECVFLGPQGCTVYPHRPVACRYYALGTMGLRAKDSSVVEDLYFVVKEDHCKGHCEPRTQTVGQYREEQGCDLYDVMNREWRDLILKKRSSGPTVGAPSARSLQLFDMCSYDMDSFRRFIQSPGFATVFDLEGAALQELIEDEDRLLAFSMRFLKQVLFGEKTIPLKERAREQRLAERREVLLRRREQALSQWRENQDDVYEVEREVAARGEVAPEGGNQVP